MSTETEIKGAKAAEANDDKINWRYQNKEYNESFKEWRKQKQNSIGFYVVEKPNQLTYQDKVGFIHDYPEAREANTFRRVINILGLILLYRVIFDIFTIYFLPFILKKMGLDIHYAFFSGARYGDETLLIVLDTITQVLGRIIPIAILIKHIQMPFSVMLPTKIINKPLFRFSTPAILLVTGVCTMMSFFYEALLENFRITSVRSLIIPTEPLDIVLFVIQMILISTVSELCTHGVLLQFTRQFGEGTALIITSLILAFVTYDITMMPLNFIIALVIGYFTIRTGSVITAVIMRIIQRFFVYSLYFLDYLVDDSYSDTLIAAFFFVTIMAGLMGTIRFFCNYSDRFSITLKERYMSVSAKILTAASSVPLIVWFTLSFAVTVLHLEFRI